MKKLPKGFTLIELLVVIAIIAVLAAAVWVALDPLDKIRAANDSKVQSDVGSLGQAEEAYATTKTGFYTDDTDAQLALVNNGDLKQSLTPPAGWGAYYFAAPAACVADGTNTCTRIVICAPLLSKKYNAVVNTGVWIYASNSGKACPIAVAANADPAARCAGGVTDATVCP